MHICVLTHASMPFGMDYAVAFAARGHRVDILSLTPCGPEHRGIPCRCVGPAGFDPLSHRHWRYVQSILPVRRGVKQIKPDILFAVYLTSAGTLACMTGHPRIVLSAHGSDVNTHLGSRLWRAIFRWQVRRARMVHLVSPHMAEGLARVTGLEPSRTLVAPVGADTSFFGPVPFSRRPNNGSILCTRSHKPVYDQATLVRAMARLRDRQARFHVTFAHPTMAEHTKALVHEMHLDEYATFLPGYKPAELVGLLAAADVYVSTSLSDGTSVSLIEAISSATFPVVSDIPANQPWVEHGRSGYLFKPGDDAALADLLADSLGNAALRQSGGERCRQIAVERGDFNMHVDRLLDAFGNILLQTTRIGQS